MNSLSIVIPTVLSSEVLLKDSLESALYQHTKPTKIIVFFNGVTAPSWVLSMAELNEHIFVFTSETKLKPHESWTRAVSYSDSSFTFILGDDDILDPCFTHNAFLLAQKFDLVNFQPRYIDENSQITGYSPCTNCGFQTPYQLLINRYSGKLDILVPGLLFKTSLFSEVSGYPDTGMPVSLYSDVMLFFKISSLVNGAYVECSPLWSYRRHRLQLSFSDSYKNVTTKALALTDELLTICLQKNSDGNYQHGSTLRLRYKLIANMSTNLSRRYFAKLRRSCSLKYALCLVDVLNDIMLNNNLPILVKLLVGLRSLRLWSSTWFHGLNASRVITK